MALMWREVSEQRMVLKWSLIDYSINNRTDLQMLNVSLSNSKWSKCVGNTQSTQSSVCWPVFALKKKWVSVKMQPHYNHIKLTVSSDHSFQSAVQALTLKKPLISSHIKKSPGYLIIIIAVI